MFPEEDQTDTPNCINRLICLWKRTRQTGPATPQGGADPKQKSRLGLCLVLSSKTKATLCDHQRMHSCCKN
jgi:hypothetical protein